MGEGIWEIGKLYKLSESAITEAARTFPGKMDKHQMLVEDIEKVKQLLNICVL
jgi:hypothetical protein